MMFIFVLPGWEGSASDSRILRDAISRPTGLKVPMGQYYLVDAGYANGDGFLAPYRGTRYHLSNWRDGHVPVNHEWIWLNIFDMLNMSGFGWNDAQKCVEVDSDEAWQSHVQHHPQAKGWRGKTFPLYEKLSKIFGKDRATGRGVETPTEMGTLNDNEEGNEDEDMNELSGGMNPMSVNQPSSDDRMNQSQSSVQRKRKRFRDR